MSKKFKTEWHPEATHVINFSDGQVVKGDFEWEEESKQKVKFVENPDGVFTAVKVK